MTSPMAQRAQTRSGKRRKQEVPALKVEVEAAVTSGNSNLENAPSSPQDSMTEYERQRQEQMRKNRERMEELQLSGLVDKLRQYTAKPARAQHRGLAKLKAKAKPAPPARQSARLRGVLADAQLAAGVKHESASGRVELMHASGWDAALSGVQAAKRRRHPEGPLPYRSDNAAETGELDSTDKAFLAVLRRLQSGADASTTAASNTSSSSTLSKTTAARLQLAASDVAKVTRDGTTGMAFHPSLAAGLLLAATDKQGNVGFWRVDQQQSDAAATLSQQAGVGAQTAADAGINGFTSMKVHEQYISAMCWLGGASGHVLATSSYDGSVRLLDANAATYELLQGLPEDIEISVMSSPDGTTFYIGNNEGELLRVDKRAPEAVTTQQVHDRRLNTIDYHRDGVMMCSSSSDATIKVWDMRKLAKPLDTLRHNKSCHAAYFAPDGSQSILSTSYDDTIRLWEQSTATRVQKAQACGWQQKLCIAHNNNTGRWLIPFRAIWGPTSDWAACCSLRKGIDILCPQTGKTLGALHSEHMTAIPSRLCVHGQAGILAAATGSGRVHLWRPKV